MVRIQERWTNGNRPVSLGLRLSGMLCPCSADQVIWRLKGADERSCPIPPMHAELSWQAGLGALLNDIFPNMRFSTQSCYFWDLERKKKEWCGK